MLWTKSITTLQKLKPLNKLYQKRIGNVPLVHELSRINNWESLIIIFFRLKPTEIGIREPLKIYFIHEFSRMITKKLVKIRGQKEFLETVQWYF
jgi:hypothetical protein